MKFKRVIKEAKRKDIYLDKDEDSLSYKTRELLKKANIPYDSIFVNWKYISIDTLSQDAVDKWTMLFKKLKYKILSVKEMKKETKSTENFNLADVKYKKVFTINAVMY